MNHIQEKRWIVDAVLFLGFIICFFLDLTGVVMHQWIGVAAGILAGYHLVTHWGWVKAVTTRFFGKTSDQAREFYLIDTLLSAGFLGMLGTGLVISTWLNLDLASYMTWRFAHVLVSIGTLLVLTLKIGLHMRWIVSVGQRLLSPRPAVAPARTPGQPVMSRRAFLSSMGVVGLASLFAFGKSIQSLASSAPTSETQAPVAAAAVTEASATSASSSGARSASLAPTTTAATAAAPVTAGVVATATTAAAVKSTTTTTNTTCVLRCNKRCSYPGQCRRYVDTNKNSKCDLGECLS
jgi:hypothetical protein